MRERIGFTLTLAACLFTVFLLGWAGHEARSPDWIPGFLVVFWSLLMMLRLMTLTEEEDVQQNLPSARFSLAHRLLSSLRFGRVEMRQKILETAFGGPFILFLSGCFLFASWQVFAFLFPAEGSIGGMIAPLMRAVDPDITPVFSGLFEWGRLFMMLLTLSIMAFMLRSYGYAYRMARPALIVLCSYAACGMILFSGLSDGYKPVPVWEISPYAGSGNRDLATLALSALERGEGSVVDILILQSGLGGIALLTFILFVPFAYLLLGSQGKKGTRVPTIFGLLSSGMIVAGLLMPMTPATGALLMLSACALFLAWGMMDSLPLADPLTKEQK